MFRAVIWGARGSIPVSSPTRCRYGTNTPCVELDLGGGDRLAIDAGTGIAALGESLAAAGTLSTTHRVLLSHFHWDHVHGLPFHPGLFDRRASFHLYGLPAVANVLSGQFLPPFSPLTPGAIVAREVRYEEVAGPFEAGGFRVRPFPLNHPQGALGYRVEARGAAVVYATDSEPDHGPLDARLIEAAAGADLLLMDSTFSPEEASGRVGWGHSSWADCVRIAQAAGVRKLVLFHHDPMHDDDVLDRKEAWVRERFPAAVCAREGMVFELA